MNKKLKIVIACLRHFKVVCNHKKIVYTECKKCGIPIQGIMHDLSKFSFHEFFQSAKYFQGDKSPIEAEKENNGYSFAWLHHKGHNPHHWEYWCDYDEVTGNVIPYKIPSNYVIEMVCDWIGAGKTYSREKWTQEEPLKYYYKVRSGRHFHPETEKLLIKLLEIIKDEGLEKFHEICKNRSLIFDDYEN